MSGTRLGRFFSSGHSLHPIYLAMVLILLSFALDMPWSVNSLTELVIISAVMFGRNFSFMLTLLGIFFAVLFSVVKLSIGREQSRQNCALDIVSSFGSCTTGIIIFIVALTLC